MKKIFALFMLAAFSAQLSFACTTFFINRNGQMVFGRNYDWITGNGMVCTNQRGLSKTSDKTREGETITWVSTYGSITFNQYGKEFPTGGMNEKGLVVELMWLDGTSYPAADKRPTVGVLQWIQYQLDNCATVDEVIANDKAIRISDDTPLHYLIADATGNAATIEFLDGKMVVHKGGNLPFAVLTNDTYSSSISATKASKGGTRSFTNNSIERFAKACARIDSYQKMSIGTPVIDYSFGILDHVAQGSHTKWSIVYDITNRKIHFKSLDFPAIKEVAFSAFDFNCSAPAKAWDMNQAGQGNVTASFVDFSLDLNNKLVNRSFDESTSQFTVGEQGRRETWQYAGKITCVKK
jgi:penicillin V acylase-like amidase (Ntn superfamily)